MRSLRQAVSHDGLQLLLFAALIGVIAVTMVPESFMRLDNRKKKEVLKNRMRRLRRKSAGLFDLDEEETECS